MIQLITLFSGIGGPEIAAEMLNEKHGCDEWIVIASCEIADFPRKVLEYYWPDAYHHTDIRTLNYETLTEKSNWNPKLPTVIIGGFPCQPFSVAGKRSGADDNRYLWPEMQRVIAEVRPVAVIGENVAGLLSMVQPGCTVRVESTTDLFSAQNMDSGGGVFGKSKKIITKESRYIADEICESLEQGGFETIPIIIPACAVGAPHRRDRIFFVAYANNHGSHGSENGQGHRERNDGSQAGEKDAEQPSGCSGETVDSNTKNKRLQGGCNSRKLREKGSLRDKRLMHVGCLSGENWKDFPTQPPVRSGDDGVSGGLDGITVSKLRNESIKAYGNAIVPQVIMQIMEALQILIKEDYE